MFKILWAASPGHFDKSNTLTLIIRNKQMKISIDSMLIYCFVLFFQCTGTTEEQGDTDSEVIRIADVAGGSSPGMVH